MSVLRSSAKTFIPGVKEHIIKKLSWHVLGVTQVKYFELEHGRQLIGPPSSMIKDSLGKEATPFHIPPEPGAEPKTKPGLVRQGPRRFNYCDN
jgi:hypothetical protein